MSKATDTLREHSKFLESIDMQETADSMRMAAKAIDRLSFECKILRDGLGAIAKKAIKDLDPIYEYMAIDALADADVVSGKQG